MNGVLVDTSVWVNHFRQRNEGLIYLLARDLVMTHPMIMGEIACGIPPQRVQTLANLERLHGVQRASVSEVIAFVERERLFGLGCGLVDLILLASALMSPGVGLWTLDKHLYSLAERFGVAHALRRC